MRWEPATHCPSQIDPPFGPAWGREKPVKCAVRQRGPPAPKPLRWRRHRHRSFHLRRRIKCSSQTKDLSGPNLGTSKHSANVQSNVPEKPQRLREEHRHGQTSLPKETALSSTCSASTVYFLTRTRALLRGRLCSVRDEISAPLATPDACSRGTVGERRQSITLAVQHLNTAMHADESATGLQGRAVPR